MYIAHIRKVSTFSAIIITVSLSLLLVTSSISFYKVINLNWTLCILTSSLTLFYFSCIRRKHLLLLLTVLYIQVNVPQCWWHWCIARGWQLLTGRR